jgi:hypothetical protein
MFFLCSPSGRLYAIQCLSIPECVKMLWFKQPALREFDPLVRPSADPLRGL